MRGVPHSDAIKSWALAMLAVGETVADTARRTGVPKQTISRWGAEADARRAVGVRTPLTGQRLAEMGRAARKKKLR